MNKEQFSKILSDPANAGSESIPLLKDLLDQFPYFQTARMLRLKLLKDTDSVLYRKDLKNTSAYAGDRTKLFHFINGGDLRQMQESAKMGLAEDGDKDELQQQLDDRKAAIDEIPDVPVEAIAETSIPEPEVPEVEVPIIDQIKTPEPRPIEDFEGITELPYSSETGLTPQEILQKRLNEIKTEKEEPTESEEVKREEITGTADSDAKEQMETQDLEERADESVNEFAEEPVLDFEPKEKVESEVPFELEDEIRDVTSPGKTAEDNAEEELSSDVQEPEEELIEEVIPYASSYIEHVDVSTEHIDEPVAEALEESLAEDLKEARSFVSWLRDLQKKSGDDAEVMVRRIEAPELPKTVSVEDDRAQQKDIIDHFIKTNPRIERKKAEFYSAQDMAKRSVEDQNELVSETLAKVYAEQGLTERAISAYEQLSLKYPQKKAYFAARIKEINDSGSIK